MQLSRRMQMSGGFGVTVRTMSNMALKPTRFRCAPAVGLALR